MIERGGKFSYLGFWPGSSDVNLPLFGLAHQNLVALAWPELLDTDFRTPLREEYETQHMYLDAKIASLKRTKSLMDRWPTQLSGDFLYDLQQDSSLFGYPNLEAIAEMSPMSCMQHMNARDTSGLKSFSNGGHALMTTMNETAERLEGSAAAGLAMAAIEKAMGNVIHVKFGR